MPKLDLVGNLLLIIPHNSGTMRPDPEAQSQDDCQPCSAGSYCPGTGKQDMLEFAFPNNRPISTSLLVVGQLCLILTHNQ